MKKPKNLRNLLYDTLDVKMNLIDPHIGFYELETEIIFQLKAELDSVIYNQLDINLYVQLENYMRYSLTKF